MFWPLRLLVEDLLFPPLVRLTNLQHRLSRPRASAGAGKQDRRGCRPRADQWETAANESSTMSLETTTRALKERAHCRSPENGSAGPAIGTGTWSSLTGPGLGALGTHTRLNSAWGGGVVWRPRDDQDGLLGPFQPHAPWHGTGGPSACPPRLGSLCTYTKATGVWLPG